MSSLQSILNDMSEGETSCGGTTLQPKSHSLVPQSSPAMGGTEMLRNFSPIAEPQQGIPYHFDTTSASKQANEKRKKDREASARHRDNTKATQEDTLLHDYKIMIRQEWEKNQSLEHRLHEKDMQLWQLRVENQSLKYELRQAQMQLEQERASL